ncbi:MAG: alpha/beta fold hydrolase [Clostridia bacterium]|nr:alpha/beta fold hydrolase [Clostridia bacterium]
MIFGTLVEKLYRQRVYQRQDISPLTFYFSPSDFEGLHWEEFSFLGHKGQKLNGCFYSYDNPDPNRLIVFDHGMGSGHRAYMREIEILAKRGYLVFSYDHTGTATSEGENINGFAQSLNDLDHCLKVLKETDRCKDRKIAVMGHSWGGFSTMNIGAIHHDITHLVALSGFISVTQIVNQSFTGILRPYRKMIYGIEEKANPDYVAYNGENSLKNTAAKVLLIHSEDDPVVKASYHFDLLKKSLQDQENITFLTLQGKKHSPNYTLDAVKYKDEYFADLSEKIKNNALTEANAEEYKATFDWWRMTAQDKEVWDKIFAHLEG